jgi:uncharacterized protein
VTIHVKVTPRSPRTEITGTMADGTLKLRIAAPADKGLANEELCRFLASHHGVARSAVEILSGHTATRKLVRIG